MESLCTTLFRLDRPVMIKYLEQTGFRWLSIKVNIMIVKTLKDPLYSIDKYVKLT